MRIPIFVRGKAENIYKSIDRGIIRYPAYIWEMDSGEWWFLNEDNEVEKNASHKPIAPTVGTIENPVVISELRYDGLYAVKGVYKISNLDGATLYSSDSFVLFTLKTANDRKYIKMISESELVDYVVEDNKMTANKYVTEEYLNDFEYVVQHTLDEKIAEVEQELYDYIDGQIATRVVEIVDERIDAKVVPASDKEIDDLFG